MRVVFMGTPEFAIPSLDALIEGPDEVIAVVTQPDKPKGRHAILTPPPVKTLAQRHNIPVYQPEKARDSAFVAILREMRPDVIVVVAYGQILSKEMLDIPPKWCINIHASLLPKYRGSAPINWAIIKGERVTGITSMIVTEKLDSGPVLLKKETPIEDDDDAQTLHDKLAGVGAELLSETMDGIKKGAIIPIPQDESEATYFPMLKKSDGLIDWTLGADQIRNRVRGLVPWPGAYTYLSASGVGSRESGEKTMLKIHKADVIKAPSPLLPLSLRERVGVRVGEGQPGTVVEMSESGILVTTGKDFLLIKELQLEGKRRMTAAEFIRGHKIEKGMILG